MLIGEHIETSSENFGEMCRSDCLLVDKSLMAKDFLEGQQSTLITAMRRSGKSLNLSMLQHFCAAEVAGLPTAGMFDRFAIAQVDGGEFLRCHQGQYPVIHISFKDIKEPTYEATLNKIRELMEALYAKHRFVLDRPNVDQYLREKFTRYLKGQCNTQELEGLLYFLSEFLYYAHGKKHVIVLIDEYDTPLTSAYEHREREPEYLEDLSKFLRNMFSAVLKGNIYLKKGLMTGILRVSKNEMLSGLSNLKTYTLLDEPYAQYFGFSEEEVQALLMKIGQGESLEAVRGYYNGYRRGGRMLYNPWSMMNYMKEKQLAAYWVWTSNDKTLKEVLIRSSASERQKLERLVQGEVIEGMVDVNMRYEELMERPDALWSLLLFCGYLTTNSSQIDGARYLCQLRIPNQEVRYQYIQVFSDWLREKVRGAAYESFLKDLVEGRVEAFTERLTGYLLCCTSSHDFQAESDYHAFMLGLLCSVIKTHYCQSNKEYGVGRPDCILVPKTPGQGRGIILEFKHIHLKSRADRSDVDILRNAGEVSAKEALVQINDRGYESAFSQYGHVREVLKVGIAFSNRLVCSAYVNQRVEAGKLVGGIEEDKIKLSSASRGFEEREETEVREAVHRDKKVRIEEEGYRGVSELSSMRAGLFSSSSSSLSTAAVASVSSSSSVPLVSSGSAAKEESRGQKRGAVVLSDVSSVEPSQAEKSADQSESNADTMKM